MGLSVLAARWPSTSRARHRSCLQGPWCSLRDGPSRGPIWPVPSPHRWGPTIEAISTAKDGEALAFAYSGLMIGIEVE
eukprot:1195510-Lingulodinium_polyedra.AAC.1